jgi:hypothetical protein
MRRTLFFLIVAIAFAADSADRIIEEEILKPGSAATVWPI